MTVCKTLGGTPVFLTRHGNAICAVGGRCLHYGAPLSDGALDGGQVICPWHHARFDVHTGANLDPPGLDPLPVYTVTIRAGDVQVHIPQAGMNPAGCEQRHVGGNVESQVGIGANRLNADQVYAIVGAGIASQSAAEELRPGE